MNYAKKRKEKKLTQAEVAKRAGISIQAYRLIEMGNTKNPKPETLKALAEILG